MQPIIVVRGYTVEIPVSLAFNVSESVLACNIRESDVVGSTSLAECVITFITDGSDGELLFTLPSEVTELIVADEGYMFFRDFTGDDPVDIFEEPLLVQFVDA